MYQFVLRVSPNVMTKEILLHFQITATDFGILTSLYYLGYALMQVPIGAFLDRYGPRYIASSFVLLCALGAILFAFSTNWTIALIARFLIGVGSSGAYISSTKVIRSWGPKKHFSLLISITATIGLLTAHQSGAITSYLMNLFGWQDALLYLSIGGFALFFFLILLVQDNPPEEKQTASKLNIAYMKSLWKKLIENKILWIGLWGCFLTGPLYVVGDVWGISYMQAVFNWPKDQATQAATIVYFGMACGGPVVAVLSEKITQHRKNLIGLLGLIMAVILGFEMVYKPSYGWVLGLNFILGVCSSYQILMFSLVVLNIPQTASGITFGIVNTINMLSGFVYLPLVGRLLDLFWDTTTENGIRVYSSFAYNAALSSIVVGLLIGSCGFFLLRLKKINDQDI